MRLVDASQKHSVGDVTQRRWTQSVVERHLVLGHSGQHVERDLVLEHLFQKKRHSTALEALSREMLCRLILLNPRDERVRVHVDELLLRSEIVDDSSEHFQ